MAEPNDDAKALMFEARDLATDAPVADVRVRLKLAGEKTLEGTTDATGAVRLVLPDVGKPRFLSATASRAGFVPLAIRWSRSSASPTPPDRLLFQMEKATAIGGLVVDQDQRPIADATVAVRVVKRYPKSEQWIDVSYETTTTGADGRWTFSNIPERPDAVELGAYHHLCLTDRSVYVMENFEPLSALADGSAVLRLRRGTLVEGTVVGPNGQPAPGAEVHYGECGRYGNSIPPVRADSEGRFTLGIRPGVSSNLIATRSGFGPALQGIRVGAEPLRVTLALQPPRALAGRVIDRAGEPIAGAQILIKHWRGMDMLAQKLVSDPDGRFLWPDAPGDELGAQISADGYIAKMDVSLTPGASNEIVLGKPTPVQGTVVDADTGRPIDDFSVRAGTVWSPGGHLIWQDRDFVEVQTKETPGAFECAFDMEAHRYALRVEAEGYLPEDAEPFEPDDSPQAFTFRLTRADPIRGVVVNPDGAPAAGGLACLSYAGNELVLWNGDLSDRGRTTHCEIAPDGCFTLPPQKDDFLLVTMNDAGFAVVRGRDLVGDDTVRLQPWSRVSGTVKLDGEPAANLDLTVDPDPPLPAEGEPYIRCLFDIKTDAKGHFEIPRVMPGRREIGRWTPNGAPGRFRFLTLATLDAEGGREHVVKIGESGRRVKGRLALSPTDDWMIRKAAIKPKTSKDQGYSIGVRIDPDGRFRADDLAPGDYALRASLHEPPPDNACGWGRLIGEYSCEFTIDGGDADDAPINLGVLEPTELGGQPLKVGDVAPDFTVKSLDGKDLALADFRGKFVLLDFWATWCAPCIAEMPTLKAIHEAHRGNPEFTIVSLSLDENADVLARFVKDLELPWLQAIAAPESPVVASYGATTIPATFLIGPDGRIIAKDLRGQQAKEAVAKALAR